MANHYDLLNLAENLISTLSKDRQEILHRAAAGRAYYFIFHHVKKHLNISCHISHKNLINALSDQAKETGDRKESVASTLMKNCKKLRVDADYWFDKYFPQKNALDALSYATKIKTLLP